MKDIIISFKLKKDLASIILAHLIYRWRLQATYFGVIIGTIILGAFTPYILNHYFISIGSESDVISSDKLLFIAAVYVICILSVLTYYTLLRSHTNLGFIKKELKYTINTWRVTRILYKKTISSCKSIRNRIACKLFDQCSVSEYERQREDKVYEAFVNEVIRATLFNIFTIYFEYQDKNLTLDENGLKTIRNVYGSLDGKSVSAIMDTKDFKNFYSTVLFEGNKGSIDSDLYNKLFERIYQSVIEYIDKDYEFANKYKKEDILELVDLTLENWCELFINLKKEN